MKNKIFGRKAGSMAEMLLLVESQGISTGGKHVDPGVLSDIALTNARRTVQMLRDKDIEGYIVFEGDPTYYEFSPTCDFIYPVSIN